MSKDKKFDKNRSDVIGNESDNEEITGIISDGSKTDNDNSISEKEKYERDIDNEQDTTSEDEYSDNGSDERSDEEDDEDVDDLEKAFEEETRRMNAKKLKRDARIPKGMTPQEYKAQKRKDAIKNIAIAFLAILLVLHELVLIQRIHSFHDK